MRSLAALISPWPIAIRRRQKGRERPNSSFSSGRVCLPEPSIAGPAGPYHKCRIPYSDCARSQSKDLCNLAGRAFWQGGKATPAPAAHLRGQDRRLDSTRFPSPRSRSRVLLRPRRRPSGRKSRSNCSSMGCSTGSRQRAQSHLEAPSELRSQTNIMNLLAGCAMLGNQVGGAAHRQPLDLANSVAIVDRPAGDRQVKLKRLSFEIENSNQHGVTSSNIRGLRAEALSPSCFARPSSGARSGIPRLA